MKFVFLNDKYNKPGASSFLIKKMVDSLTSRGHTCTVITTHRTEESPEIIRSTNIISLPISYRISLRAYKSLWNPKVSTMLKKELMAINPDVVHAHNIHTYLTYDALRIAHNVTENVCLTFHDVMSFHYGRLNTKRFLNSKGKNAKVSTIEQIRVARLQFNPFRNAIIRKKISRYVKFPLAVSRALQQALQQNGIPNVEVLHNFIDPSEWPTANTNNSQPNTILFGGRISYDKGAHLLMRAMATILKTNKDVTLIVAGKKEQWESIAKNEGLYQLLIKNTRLVGWQNRKQLLELYSSVAVVTTPSICLDTFNLMNAEAMMSAKPVVGTCFGGTPEVVLHNETGFICDPRNTEVYANYILELLNNPDKAIAFGATGKRRACTMFAIEPIIDKYLNLF